MIRVVKEHKQGQNDVICIQTDDGILYISFSKDLSLYFTYSSNGIENNDEYSFVIDKEQGFIYECFDGLYDSVMSQKPFKYSDNLPDTDFSYPLSNCTWELVHDDDVIDWHSEDCTNYDLSSALSIEKDSDSYLVVFKKSKERIGESAYSVCVRNANSVYDPYNTSFVILYNRLRNHDFELDDTKRFSRTRKR